MIHTLAAQDYTQLIQTGGPVLVAFVVFFIAVWILGKQVMLPALTMYRAITLDVAHITDTLKDTRKRLESVANQLDIHLPTEHRKNQTAKSIYDT